jgi:carboxylesterase type B
VSEATFKEGRAPVLVWIHGGGYIMRNKAEGGSPIGILERSAEYAEGAVFVAIAYRVCVYQKRCRYSLTLPSLELSAG